MKKYMILLLLGAALSLYASVLSPSGKSLPCEAVTILIPEKPTLAESFAGKLLKKYLEKREVFRYNSNIAFYVTTYSFLTNSVT